MRLPRPKQVYWAVQMPIANRSTKAEKARRDKKLSYKLELEEMQGKTASHHAMKTKREKECSSLQVCCIFVPGAVLFVDWFSQMVEYEFSEPLSEPPYHQLVHRKTTVNDQAILVPEKQTSPAHLSSIVLIGAVSLVFIR
ncbi:hypothetical protein KIN20_023290 [Parelaphostrongylus tenuis]|uniref:Uncharacterized protein n=1 Tax=Parelaphostrongylus tenuis TaxID=148309 RepID=A0AAD5MRS8_PARTN|nr:hypothetical protein KIN20_023290 [Parelaphostrongylus tenuis]